MSRTILVVEDEPDLVANLVYNLEREGFQARAAETGKAGLAAAWTEPVPELVLLDLMLPDMSGTEVCRRLRADPRTAAVPVIMLTARGEEIDRVVGFEVGADDYVTKPFSVRELMLRVRAVLRRAQARPEGPGGAERFGRLTLDEAAHKVAVDGQEVSLTALEFRLLGAFMASRGRVQTREKLLDEVWGYDSRVTTRTVDTHVKRLREKLGPASDYIETIRGVGYRFAASPDGDGA